MYCMYCILYFQIKFSTMQLRESWLISCYSFLISTVSVRYVFLINCQLLPSTKFHFTLHFSCSAQHARATLAHHADNDCCHVHTDIQLKPICLHKLFEKSNAQQVCFSVKRRQMHLSNIISPPLWKINTHQLQFRQTLENADTCAPLFTHTLWPTCPG